MDERTRLDAYTNEEQVIPTLAWAALCNKGQPAKDGKHHCSIIKTSRLHEVGAIVYEIGGRLGRPTPLPKSTVEPIKRQCTWSFGTTSSINHSIIKPLMSGWTQKCE